MREYSNIGLDKTEHYNMVMKKIESKKDRMVFETVIPVFSSFIARGMFTGLGIIMGIFGLVVGLVIMDGGKFSQLTPDIYFAIGMVIMLFVLTYMVMAIVFRNGFVSKIEIGGKGVSQVSMSPTKNVNTAAIIGGMLTKSPGAVGAGLLAEAGDDRFLSWNEIGVIKINQKTKYMYFSKGKWGLFPIGFFCPENKYVEVLEIIKKNSCRVISHDSHR